MIINIFRIYPGERTETAVAGGWFALLNLLNVLSYWDKFTAVGGNTWSKFVRGWHLSGFDPITYSVVTEWRMGYNVYRHPLLAYFMWPLSKLNEGLTWLTGRNLAIVLAAMLLVVCATYSVLFVNRIHRRVIGLGRKEGAVMTALTFSFAYVMLAAIAPDHFMISMFCLTLTLYLCGMKIKKGSAMNMWQTIMMFFLTAGVSLNNGLKIFLAAMVTRRRRFFEWKYLLFAVVMPSALIWGSARWSYHHFVWPHEMERDAKKVANEKRQVERLRAAVLDTISVNDTASVNRAVEKALAEKKAQKERKFKKSALYKHTGKPIMEGEFMKWTDVSTSRIDVAVENLLGEGIMLHEDYLLGDVLVNRPVIVPYRNKMNYVVECMLIVIFVLGVWKGRRERFLWTAMSFLLMDMVLHMGLGFGINEVYIMSAHYIFVLPIAMSYVVIALDKVWRQRLVWLLAAVALYLAIWNTDLYVEYIL